ncbi:MAG: hypothetical protein HN337_02510 [Deltaproteobacteria bacterium]|nr:hypothetical protein [Deltaproteobacteria bacterium]
MIKSEQIFERLLPDYRRRHIFTTKLRLLAFVGFWAIFLLFMKGVLGQTKIPAAIIIACFSITGFAYYNIIRGRWLVPSFIFELLSDLVAITVVIYLTGGPHSPHFTIYLFYVFIAGAIYNHYLAGLVAICCALTYAAFLFFCDLGIIPPLIINYGDQLPLPAYTPIAHLLFMIIFLAVVVYTVKVAIYFSQQRERALEKRNRELTALHKVSSAVRSVAILKDVIQRLLVGVLEGLRFETVMLLHFDKDKKVARLFTPRKHPKLSEIEGALGMSLTDVEVPLKPLEDSNPIMSDLVKQRIVFRRDLFELIAGVGLGIGREQCDQVQKVLGVRKIIAMPLVLENNVLGAMIGFSKDPYLEDEQVATLESFANQAAMSLEAAIMVDRLRKVNDQLKEANQVKSEFLATMSHELRTPLTAIIGFSELLIEGVMGDMTDEQKESLQEVLHNAADLLDMINSLLDLTKLESGRMILDVTKFDISTTIKRVVNTISPLVHRKEQDLMLDLGENVPIIDGDERKVQQVVLNLIANANKFTPARGEIGLTLNYCPSVDNISANTEMALRIKRLGLKSFIQVEVTDNGIGIPDDQREMIFEMFHQADSSVTRSFGGTGLGLALAKQFIEMHGGDIWVESKIGEGAKFLFVLPVGKSTAG